MTRNTYLITQSENHSFSLKFKNLSSLPIQNHQNFTLVVNNIVFRTNLDYLCCVSKVILANFNQNPKLSSFTIEIPNQNEEELFNCLASFLNFIHGSAFSFGGFGSEVFFRLLINSK
jgi:hypothetical protein